MNRAHTVKRQASFQPVVHIDSMGNHTSGEFYDDCDEKRKEDSVEKKHGGRW